MEILKHCKNWIGITTVSDLQCCIMSGWQISINQRYMHNAIYDNWAFAYNRSTMFLKSAKFQIMYNFFLNPYNVFDITTFNRTKFVLSVIIHSLLHCCIFLGYLVHFIVSQPVLVSFIDRATNDKSQSSIEYAVLLTGLLYNCPLRTFFFRLMVF